MDTLPSPLHRAELKPAGSTFEAAYEAWREATIRARQAEDLVLLKISQRESGAGPGPTVDELNAVQLLRNAARTRLQYAIALIGSKPL